jgi:hypothetical protein
MDLSCLTLTGTVSGWNRPRQDLPLLARRPATSAVLQYPCTASVWGRPGAIGLIACSTFMHVLAGDCL